MEDDVKKLVESSLKVLSENELTDGFWYSVIEEAQLEEGPITDKLKAGAQKAGQAAKKVGSAAVNAGKDVASSMAKSAGDRLLYALLGKNFKAGAQASGRMNTRAVVKKLSQEWWEYSGEQGILEPTIPNLCDWLHHRFGMRIQPAKLVNLLQNAPLVQPAPVAAQNSAAAPASQSIGPSQQVPQQAAPTSANTTSAPAPNQSAKNGNASSGSSSPNQEGETEERPGMTKMERQAVQARKWAKEIDDVLRDEGINKAFLMPVKEFRSTKIYTDVNSVASIRASAAKAGAGADGKFIDGTRINREMLDNSKQGVIQHEEISMKEFLERYNTHEVPKALFIQKALGAAESELGKYYDEYWKRYILYNPNRLTTNRGVPSSVPESAEAIASDLFSRLLSERKSLSEANGSASSLTANPNMRTQISGSQTSRPQQQQQTSSQQGQVVQTINNLTASSKLNKEQLNQVFYTLASVLLKTGAAKVSKTRLNPNDDARTGGGSSYVGSHTHQYTQHGYSPSQSGGQQHQPNATPNGNSIDINRMNHLLQMAGVNEHDLDKLMHKAQTSTTVDDMLRHIEPTEEDLAKKVFSAAMMSIKNTGN